MNKPRRRAVFCLALVLLLALAGCRTSQTVESRPTLTPLTEVTPSAQPAGTVPDMGNEVTDIGNGAADTGNQSFHSEKPQGNDLEESGTYDSVEDVALYLRTYGELPDNYITKDEAGDLGWNGGSVERYAPGKCIGGDTFSNREGLLPKANGRVWTECDIDTLGENGRGAKRIVYSNDGLIYYTDDHYQSFEKIYP